MRTRLGLVGCGVLAASVLGGALAAAQAPDPGSTGERKVPAGRGEHERKPAQQKPDPPAPAANDGRAPAGGAAVTTEQKDAPAAPPLAAPIVLDGGERPGGSPAPAGGGSGATAAAAARPIASSVERQVEQVVRTHEEPCASAGAEGTPCFPVTVEEEGVVFSVEDSIKDYKPDERRAPGVPTVAEIQQQMNPHAPSGGVGGDPVCAVKSLVRAVRGGSSTFYLYKLTKDGVERPLLTDEKIDTLAYAAAPGAVVDFIGQFSGECDAVAAWRKALREANAPEADEGRRKTPRRRPAHESAP